MSKRTMLLVLVVVALVAPNPRPVVAEGSKARYGGLVVGVPHKDIGEERYAGEVCVLYADARGIVAADSETWHQDTNGIRGGAEDGDILGQALAVGDFDGDGFFDVAAGAPHEDIEGADCAGAVNVLYGTGNGLSADGNQMWTQHTDGIAGSVEECDYFGSTLAVGDFDGDGCDDLAVGVPCESIGDIISAGAVNVIYGSPAGLTAEGNQIWHQDTDDVRGACELYDFFGNALAAGDLDGDGYDDLAVGVPYEDVGVGSTSDAGMVHVLYGSPQGLTADGNQIWHQDSEDIAGGAEADDAFGCALAIGDMNGDGYADLAIGVPFETIDDIPRSGAVNMLYGSSDGPTADGNQMWHQNLDGVGAYCQQNGHYGTALSSGDYDGDGRDDLAVGVPDYSLSGEMYAGMVHVLYGSDMGLAVDGNQIWHQASEGVAGTADSLNRFGDALASTDLDGDGHADLAVGVPADDEAGLAATGAVNLLYGSPEGLSPAFNQLWHQEVDGIAGQAEQGDRFGSAVAAWPYRRDSVSIPMVIKK